MTKDCVGIPFRDHSENNTGGGDFANLHQGGTQISPNTCFLFCLGLVNGHYQTDFQIEWHNYKWLTLRQLSDGQNTNNVKIILAICRHKII